MISERKRLEMRPFFSSSGTDAYVVIEYTPNSANTIAVANSGKRRARYIRIKG